MVNKLQTITFTALWDVKRTFFQISDIENEFPLSKIIRIKNILATGVKQTFIH